MSRLIWSPLALAMVAAIVLAGCGGGSDTDGSTVTGTGEAASTTASAATSVSPPPTEAPTEISIDEPLSGTPAKGKEVIFLKCEVPSCERYVRGIEAGAKALGWKSKVMPLSNTDPGSSLDAAIAEKPDFIGMSGIPAAAIKSQLAKAAAAGIPVVSCGTTDPASADGYAAECQGTLVPMAEYLSRWIAADSNGEANVLAVTLPQFPALVSETEWFKSPAFQQICQNCSFDELGVTGEDLAEGKTGAKLVGYLQTHPEIDYVVFTVGDLATGVLPELKTAGISPSSVKLTAAVENEEVQAAIANGEFSAATTSPNAYLGMTQVDAMARLSLDGRLSKQYQESIYNSMPTWVVDSPEAAEALGGELWEGPEGFERQFEALWGVH